MFVPASAPTPVSPTSQAHLLLSPASAIGNIQIKVGMGEELSALCNETTADAHNDRIETEAVTEPGANIDTIGAMSSLDPLTDEEPIPIISTDYLDHLIEVLPHIFLSLIQQLI